MSADRETAGASAPPEPRDGARRPGELSAQIRSSFLTEAFEVLGGSTEYAITLASVARLAVPRMADACVVHLAHEDGRVHRLAVAHADPAREETLGALLERRPVDSEGLPRAVARVLRSGEAAFLRDGAGAREDPLEEEVDDAELAAELLADSVVIVPLRVRERVLGSMSFGWSAPRCYTRGDVWALRLLADRAAVAVENARLRRSLKRAGRASSDLMASMSHEFRTPLTTVMAFADMLVAGIPEPVTGAALRHAERIASGAKHLARLVDQVLTLSRIEAGRERAHLEPVELVELVRDTASLVEPLAAQKGLALRLELPEWGVLHDTDANKLRQVLFNLLGNAVKFTKAGEIRVVLRDSGNRIVIEVRDTGEGIATENLDRIWEPFWRAGVSAETPPGSGLGLGIVRRLVRILGGEVRVWSRPGQGSVFTIELQSEAHDL